MDKPEKNKRLPLLILGQAPLSLAPFACLPLSEKAFPMDPDLYFLLCANEAGEAEALEGLNQARVPADQILLARGEGFSRAPVASPMGILELLPGESAEEQRFRLTTRLETQRHRKLSRIMDIARAEGLPSGLKAEEWGLRLETAHLAHGFCCALDLPASLHERSLRSALSRGEAGSPWPAELPMEHLLSTCARLALQHWRAPTSFREEFRTHASQLPFRTRTDLRNVVERCLETIWKGLENAAYSPE